MRAKLERYNQHVISEALSADNPPAGLEDLLPALKVIVAATIQQTVYPPIAWIVPDLLPPGLTFISGKPKAGKSWLALQLALSVSTGGKMFGRDVEKGKVLYLALEDNERRLQDRMTKQAWPTNHDVEFMLLDIFRDQITALNTGGGKRLLKYVDRRKYRVVIVDTFSRAIQGDQLDPSEMTEAVGPIQQYALSKNLALVVIDHMPKNTIGETDPISHIFGSVAKAAVTDTAWGLYKKNGIAGAELAITGRDVPDSTLKLTFDKSGWYWHCEGNADEIAMTETRLAILAAVEEFGEAQVKDIADAIGQGANHVRERLNELANEGKITRAKSGKAVIYRLVG
ncbi:MAG: AAA family ATPase [Chloroflexota bacterium]